MKIFDLQCAAGHRFEGWFASREDYVAQRKRGLVGCPSCGGLEVERVPSATRFNTGAQAPAPRKVEQAEADPMAIAQKLYSRMLDDLLTRSEDVGVAFPDEARRIHYHEAPERMIRGQATQEEHDALLDEGIAVARLPVPPARRLN
ncbi:MAG: DUF1178 family protein [Burkholderiales bacterium]